MPELFVNDPGTTLNGAINNSTTTIVVASSSGYPSSGDFRIKIDSELMLVTAVSGTTWTVTRGIESTSAASHNNGATVSHVLSGGGITQATTGWALFGPTYDSTTAPSSTSFSWRNQGTATVTAYGNSSYVLAATASGDNVKGREITAPATPYTITVCLIPQLHAVNYNTCGVYFADNSSSRITGFGVTNVVMQINDFTNATTWSAQPLSVAFATTNSPIWLQITDNGTNHLFSWSSNGMNFHQVFSRSRTSFLAAPNRVGWFVNSNHGSLPAGAMLTYWKQS